LNLVILNIIYDIVQVPDQAELMDLEINDQQYNFFCLDEVTEMQSGTSPISPFSNIVIVC